MLKTLLVAGSLAIALGANAAPRVEVEENPTDPDTVKPVVREGDLRIAGFYAKTEELRNKQRRYIVCARVVNAGPHRSPRYRIRGFVEGFPPLFSNALFDTLISGEHREHCDVVPLRTPGNHYVRARLLKSDFHYRNAYKTPVFLAHDSRSHNDFRRQQVGWPPIAAAASGRRTPTSTTPTLTAAPSKLPPRGVGTIPGKAPPSEKCRRECAEAFEDPFFEDGKWWMCQDVRAEDQDGLCNCECHSRHETEPPDTGKDDDVKIVTPRDL